MEAFGIAVISLLFVIFVSFSGLFLGSFVLRSIRGFEGVSSRISLRGSWVDALRIFVCDLDPSNVGKSLRFVSFWPEFMFLVVVCVIRDSLRFSGLEVEIFGA